MHNFIRQDKFEKTAFVQTAFLLLLWTGVSFAELDKPQLRITSPVDGTVVTPGQKVRVVATAAPNVKFSKVIIIGQNPIGFSDICANPPFQFTITIPGDISLGRYSLTASGVITPGQGVESDPIALVVEKADIPARIITEPSKIIFDDIGEQIPITVMSISADGSHTDVTQSSRVTYSSNDAAIATVNGAGLVTAKGYGSTGKGAIAIHYQNQSIVVPVTIELRQKKLSPPSGSKPPH